MSDEEDVTIQDASADLIQETFRNYLKKKKVRRRLEMRKRILALKAKKNKTKAKAKPIYSNRMEQSSKQLLQDEQSIKKREYQRLYRQKHRLRLREYNKQKKREERLIKKKHGLHDE